MNHCRGRARVEGAAEVRVPVGADGVAGVAVAGGVVAELGREGEAGLGGDDGAGGPADGGDARETGGMGEEAAAGTEGQFIASVDGSGVAQVGGGRTPVQFGAQGEGDKRGRIAADAGIPCGTVVEVLAEGVVAAQLEAIGEGAAHVDQQAVIEADSLRHP